MRYLPFAKQHCRGSLLILACLTVVVLLALPNPVSASDSSPVFAGWISNIQASLATRTRVIQVCFVAMCLALFILMKKFADLDDGPRQ